MTPQHPEMIQIASGDLSHFHNFEAEFLMERHIVRVVRLQIDVLTDPIQCVHHRLHQPPCDPLTLPRPSYHQIQHIPAMIRMFLF